MHCPPPGVLSSTFFNYLHILFRNKQLQLKFSYLLIFTACEEKYLPSVGGVVHLTLGPTMKLTLGSGVVYKKCYSDLV